MTTEDGLPRTSHVRNNIEVLRRRMEFLAWRIQDHDEAGRAGTLSFDVAEQRALEWALPVLEAEFDFVARWQREIRVIEDREVRKEEEPCTNRL